jgi:hypothetical protein
VESIRKSKKNLVKLIFYVKNLKQTTEMAAAVAGKAAVTKRA